jgi:ribosome-associated protein
MIRVTRDIAIDETELSLSFIRSSGPGGQNVNKVSTAVELRFDVKGSPNLSQRVKNRLLRLAGQRANRSGEIVLVARNQRSQEQNRKAAVDRLLRLIRRAAQRPKQRKPTRRPKWAEKKRLEQKRRRGRLKKLRKNKVPPQ